MKIFFPSQTAARRVVASAAARRSLSSRTMPLVLRSATASSSVLPPQFAWPTSSSSSSSSLPQTRTFSSGSDDSHSDFAPKKKAAAVDAGMEEALKLIDGHVKSNKVMLYMKGNPSVPMCGFSATVVQILQKEGVDFASVNILDYPAIREGVKKYSDWPTIPQLYVNGEFVGGCDIIKAMHEAGELKELFSEVAEEK